MDKAFSWQIYTTMARGYSPVPLAIRSKEFRPADESNAIARGRYVTAGTLHTESGLAKSTQTTHSTWQVLAGLHATRHYHNMPTSIEGNTVQHEPHVIDITPMTQHQHQVEDDDLRNPTWHHNQVENGPTYARSYRT